MGLRRLRGWFVGSIIIVPLVLGLVFALGVWAGTIPSQAFITFQVSIALAATLLGLALSLVMGLAWWLNRRLSDHVLQGQRRQLSRLDHELKNPLTAIRATLANIAEASTESAREKAVSNLQRQVIRLNGIVSEWRRVSDVETQPMELTDVNVNHLLHEVVALAKDNPIAIDRQVSLFVAQAPRALPLIRGDYELLVSALSNLLDNALKYTNSNDVVEVRAREIRGAIEIEVADTGRGIAQNELTDIWDESVRGSGVGAVPGSGLGLAHVRAVVQRHHGTVTVTSRPEQGTAFVLR